ncbi:MAG: prolyl aminopeptidase [Steroidobacteraceae bacterium]|jgi:proline iminopeptidase
MSPDRRVQAGRRTLYPPIEPYRSGWLRVSDLHELYYEESGRPDGIPAVFLHGGPGTGADARARQFFNPERYRIVVFDQRGAGRSRPHASLEDNTTSALIADLETLRQHLGIEQWLAFGGSWGSLLAIAYAESHPQRIHSLVLRGIFLGREREIRWFNQSGASEVFPEQWAVYLEPIPAAERHDLVAAYYRRLTSPDAEVVQAAARSWAYWEAATSFLDFNCAHVARWSADRLALAIARIECHFVYHRAFLRWDSQLLDELPRVSKIPGIIIHGRYDMVCPVRSALDLHSAWPGSVLQVVPDAGHSAFEPGTIHELIEATDCFAEFNAFSRPQPA